MRKLMKKGALIFALAGVLVFAFCLSAGAVTYGKCGDNLTWMLDSDGTLTISGEGEMWNWEFLSSAPWSNKNSSNSSIKTVVIENGVTSIGKLAFYDCSVLTNIKLPDSITSIGVYAFDGCKNLTSIYVAEGNPRYTSVDGALFSKDMTELIKYPIGSTQTEYVITDSVTSIGMNAFEDCEHLTSIVIPNSVTSIGYSAFSGCTGLTSVTIPNSVTSIGGLAFSGCSKLTSVAIADSVTSIGYKAFVNTAYYNDESNWDAGVLYIGNHLIQAKEDIFGEYVVKEGTLRIAHSAFYRCYKLTGISIPDGVTAIDGCTFEGCGKLESIIIPNSVTSIGAYAFEECSSLKNIHIPDGVTAIGDFAFSYCTDLASLSIPNSVTSIGNYAFSSCTSLISVSIGSGLAELGERTFIDCRCLTSIDVSGDNSNYISLDGVLFNKEMTELIQHPVDNNRTEYAVPNGVTTIGDAAFSACAAYVHIPSHIERIAIPASVTSIGEQAFAGCEYLTDVYYSGTEEQWNEIEISEFNDMLTFAKVHFNSSAQPDSVTVLVNGGAIDFDVAPIILDGTTMLPVRKALEPLGAEFIWDGDAQTVTINANGKNIVITIGDYSAKVDGDYKDLLKPAMIIDGRTLIPIRFVAEELGYNVGWDGDTKTVSITQ